MIWQPQLMALLSLEILALLFALYAAVPYLRVLLSWDPCSSDRAQLRLERATDSASLAMRGAIILSVAASLLLILALSWSLPSQVPGAMCGTGVLQSTGGLAERALALRGLASAALWIWLGLDLLNRAAPRAPKVPEVARWQLLALPLLLLAGFYTLRALLQLDPHTPVDCCQAVYDNFSSPAQAQQSLGISDSAWLWLTGVGGFLLLSLSLMALWRLKAAEFSSGFSKILALLALIWAPTASLTLIRVLSAYHYEVLHHHCPWCLFLPEHNAVGYPLYGALLLIPLEALLLPALISFAHGEPSLKLLAQRHQRRALLLIILSLLIFGTLTLGPALIWRFHYGVWMQG